jgi:two-component system sensor histidine kinase YesM
MILKQEERARNIKDCLKKKDWTGFFKILTGDENEKIFRSGIQNYVQNLFKTVKEKPDDRILKISALESQINPHFLYNTLESIRGQAIVSGSVDIAKTTEALAVFFRYSISQKRNIVTLQDEINNIKNYFLIQKYRFDDRFQLEILTDDNDISDYVLPKLTLQPIVENAIFHGLETKEGSGTVKIAITTTVKRLLITVSDNGLGMTSEILDCVNQKLRDDTFPSEENSGIALVNVNRRIKLFFGDQYGLQIYSIQGKGTDVEIVLPLVKIDKVIREKAINEK